MFRRMAALTALLGLLGLVSGCSDGGKPTDVKRAKVSGVVKLEGKPLKTGKIIFDAGNGEPPAVMDILDGNYEGKAAIGKNKVQLTSTRKVSMKEKMKMDGPGYDTMVEENLLPPRYNTKSEISRDVEAAGENTFNFDLQSK